jgi:hypothetical protein
MHKNVDAVLVAQLEQFCEFWSDLPLIFQADKNVGVDKELTVGHIASVRIWRRIY